MYTRESRTFICQSLKLLDHLLELGYEPFEEGRNIHDINYKVWYFNNSDELFQIVTEYYKTHPKYYKH